MHFKKFNLHYINTPMQLLSAFFEMQIDSFGIKSDIFLTKRVLIR